jgi:hypothetical protein
MIKAETFNIGLDYNLNYGGLKQGKTNVVEYAFVVGVILTFK